MKWTNLYNLPQPLVDAIMDDQYDKVGDLSVSESNEPPRMRQLKKRYNDLIVEDVSEGIWRLIGNIGHKILERSNTDNHLAEERLTMRAHGWVISGKADLLEPDMTLNDYKFPSVWAMKYAKPDYEAQLNLYALLYRRHGFVAKRLRIVAPLRDWSKLKASREKQGDYPQVGVVVREVPLWSIEAQEMFLSIRVLQHQKAEELADDDLPMCTEEERWHKPDTYAVMKKGNMRATAVRTTEESAFDVIRDQMVRNPKLSIGQFNVEHRPGEDTRCLHYCVVKNFCSHGKTLAPASEETEAA